ncbi:mannitol dehydrogenase family protein [Streptomyces montanisoli]|uniref:Mannitol-1-phosphate 5-dehydrogenase n=1 Tax=Streptomyces montanisoli TaxID=2798581 RepID=A0A940MEE7_9ACTN|nr:mannitol dehydrogenase family protein [Streptomyces montanisoli]MBP0458480.1 mannitol dehydrogenase family protein [Streptomyces montanisoli]
MTGLSNAALDALPHASLPAARPGGRRPRIVHLGLGAFHRAHQALYTEAAEEDWGIAGVAQHSRAVLDALRAQDNLYSVTFRDPEGPATRVSGALAETLHATEDAGRLRELLAAPATAVVTTTVTEKGYRRDPAGGGLDLTDPLIVADLAAGPDRGAHATPVGQLAAGLRARLRGSGAPMTVVCCDNMAGNGPVLARLVREFTAATAWPERDELLSWLASDAVSFPATVVDRIVPATTEGDLATAARALGVRDAAAVSCEPYTQWVIEDRFAGARPHWEAGGAEFVADVTPYQLTKLRLLNGAHTLLAHLGLRDGRTTVADALATGWGESAVRTLCAEVAPTLPTAPGLDVPAYVDTLVERFTNPAVRHRLDQVATDSSLKIPERWLTPVRELRAAGHGTPYLARALAVWAAASRDGLPYADPAAARLHAAWQTRKPADAVRALLALLGAEDLAADDALVAEVTGLLPR